jgi:hypothetical protein
MDTREQKHFGVGGQWLAKLTILLRIATTLIGGHRETTVLIAAFCCERTR